MSNSLQPHGLQHPGLLCPSLSLQSLLKFMSSDAIWQSNHLILCCLLLLLPSIFPSIRNFSSVSSCIRWSKYWSVSFNITHSNEYSNQYSNEYWFPLGLTSLTSLQFKGLSRVFSSTTVQKHQLFGTQPSLRSNSHIHTWLLKKP